MQFAKFGACAVPADQGGQVPCGSVADALAVAISSALTGTLTITSLVSPSGSPAPWVINAGTSGVVVPTGGSTFQGPTFYALSNPADIGKVLIAWNNH